MLTVCQLADSAERGSFTDRRAGCRAWSRLGISFALAAAVLVCYWPVHGHEFIAYDDREYLTDNPIVQQGLTARGAAWAFTTFHVANWHPLTWLSHMLDVELHGLNAGRHLLTNVAFHVANAVLVFLVLNRMTRSGWRSALAAGLFALHPLHVESVAWAAERKDLLSALFGLLAIWAYIRFTERRTAGRHLIVILWLALSLMSKPMFVTLPFVLLLLDVWPLGRLNVPGSADRPIAPVQNKFPATLWPLVIEKLPLLVMSAVSCVITIMAQRQGGAIRTLEFTPIGPRLANAAVSYGQYVIQTFWPVDLAVMYPYQHDLASWQVAGAAVALLAVTVFVVLQARRRPHLLVGWLWFLGMLVPVIGLVQVGDAGRADRYTYFPLIGLFIMIAWSIPAPKPGRASASIAAAGACGVVLALLALRTAVQVRYWANTRTLFERTLEITGDNALAHYNLGTWFLESNDSSAAAGHLREAARINRRSPQILTNLGLALKDQGEVDQAIDLYRQALAIRPDYAEAYHSLGSALVAKGKLDEAAWCYRQAIALTPDSFESRFNLGQALIFQGRVEEGVAACEEAMRLRPYLALPRVTLAEILFTRNRFDLAVVQFEQALRLEPENAEVHNNLGVALARLGRIPQAIDHFQQALKIKPDYAQARLNLEKCVAAASSPSGTATRPGVPEP